MKLIDLYKNTITSIGLGYSSDHFITNPMANNKQVSVDKLPWVLPTPDRIKLATQNNNGKIELVTTLFNPLKENAVNGDSTSLKKMRNVMDVNISHRVSLIGEYLIKLGMDPKLQTKATMNVKLFLSSLMNLRTPGRKVLCDDKALKNWIDTYDNSLDLPESKGMFHIYKKKGGKVDNVKYASAVYVDFPIFRELLKLEKSEGLFDLNYRSKDKEIFQAIYRQIFGNEIDTETLANGSNNNECPSYQSLMSVYLVVVNKINRALSDLSKIFKDAELETYILKHEIEPEHIANLDKLISEVETIPELKTQTSLAVPVSETNTSSRALLDKIHNKTIAPVKTHETPNHIPMMQQPHAPHAPHPQQMNPQRSEPKVTENDSRSILQKIASNQLNNSMGMMPSQPQQYPQQQYPQQMYPQQHAPAMSQGIPQGYYNNMQHPQQGLQPVGRQNSPTGLIRI